MLSMVQKGPTSGMSPNNYGLTIDSLTYHYFDNSNRLKQVDDGITIDYGIGDFQDNNAGIDYAYDANGNLTQDLNKGIVEVSYNHLNRPVKVTFDNGDEIDYLYDALGNKLVELVNSQGEIIKRDYVGNFMYLNDSLSFLSTAVGRSVHNEGNFREEYFVKDYLGNVRSVIDLYEYPMVEYLATYEIASANLEGMFFDYHGEVRDDKPGSTDPEDNQAGRLNGGDPERRIGTALFLKVMAGDKVEMNVNNFYDNFDESHVAVEKSEMLGSILSTFTNGIGGFEGGEASNPGLVNEYFNAENWNQYYNFLDEHFDDSRPKAYLNYILYHEDGSISDFSGAFQVNGNGTWSAIGTTEPLKIPINGYLSIFLSNWETLECYCEVSQFEGNVYFDLLQVRFMQGQVKEETHYYPHGLPMGDSEASAHGFVQNRHKHQGNEYIREVGLDWMDFHARQYDPQIGRFLGVDPLADVSIQDRFSPYAAMGNNPVRYSDPSGLLFNDREDNNHIVRIPEHLGSIGGFTPATMGFMTGMDGTDFNVTFRPAPLKLSEEQVEFILEVLSNMGDGVYHMNIGVIVEGEDIVTITLEANEEGSGGFESVVTANRQSSEGVLGSIWNSALARAVFPDKISIGMGGDMAAFVGVGAQALSISVLTRGKEPGIYLTPTFNINAGIGVSVSGGFNFGVSTYTGNPRNITSDMIIGSSHGGMVTGGFLGNLSIGGSHTNTKDGHGFINKSIGVGIGFGAFGGYQYQYTSGAVKLWGRK